MNWTLDELQRRVLGVLMEKALTQPAGYPMTVNSIVAGCNQKSNRDPVMELDEDAVWTTLETLRERGLVSKVLPPPGSRSERYKHDVAQAFNWQTPQRAIMTELMLRGPQTPGELRTRCERMSPFASVAEVVSVLDALQNWDPPLVRPLPRQAGQAATRYTHLLAPAGERETVTADVPTPVSPSVAPRPAPAPIERSPAPVAAAPPADNGLREALGKAQAELKDMRETLADFNKRLARLEARLGLRSE